MKTAVFSVVYPAAKPYLGDFFKSLEGQSDKDFDLLLVSDGLDKTGLSANQKKETIVIEGRGTPVQLRKRGITEALERGYEAIVFADSDDWFKPNRVEVCKRMLSKYPLVFNDLLFAGKNMPSESSMFGDRLSEGQSLSMNDLVDGNCLGLSNTAIRTNAVKNAHESVPDGLALFDWPFFLRVMRAGAKAVFTRRTVTYYRQDSAESSPFSIDPRLIERGTAVKAQVYASLADLGEPFKTLSREFGDRRAEAVKIKNPFWWEFIQKGAFAHDKDR